MTKIMGNCKRCYYYTPNQRKGSDDGVCHRYPQALDIDADNYCAEFVRLLRELELTEW